MTTESAPAKPSNWNVPNVLTAIRVVLVPVFAWMLLSHPDDPTWRWWSTAVFTIAILTDMADGRIARSRNLVTDFGKLWDPIADKALTGMAFVGLSIIGDLWWWVTIVILVREWGITVLRWAIMKYGVMAANRGGKLKTVMQSIALILYLMPLPAAAAWPPSGWLEPLSWVAMAVAFLLTVITGLDYLREAHRLKQRYLAEQGTTP